MAQALSHLIMILVAEFAYVASDCRKPRNSPTLKPLKGY